MVVVAQLVRASDCDSEGRGFEPPRLPQPKPNIEKGFGFFMSNSYPNYILKSINNSFSDGFSLQIN